MSLWRSALGVIRFLPRGLKTGSLGRSHILWCRAVGISASIESGIAINAAERSDSDCATVEIPRKGNVRTVGAVYSFSDTGSDSFFGDSLFSKETNSRPEAGIPTLPSLTISLAPMSRP